MDCDAEEIDIVGDDDVDIDDDIPNNQTDKQIVPPYVFTFPFHFMPISV